MGDESETSEYGVFIIESMDAINERQGNLDGYALKTILDLCGIPNIYYHIRTKLELEEVLKEFETSKFRFLHIACHGNKKELALTYESIEFSELEMILGDYLYHRRLFLSACEVAVFELAQFFIPKYHCFSVIGTPNEITYDKAAIFWSSFYYFMYSNDSTRMVQVDILPTLLKVSEFFNINLNYFSIINDKNPKSINHLNEFTIVAGKKTNKVRITPFNNQYRPNEVPLIPGQIITDRS